MIDWMRDWWRGYTDADVESIRAKLNRKDYRAGEIIPITAREHRAMRKVVFVDETRPLSHE